MLYVVTMARAVWGKVRVGRKKEIMPLIATKEEEQTSGTYLSASQAGYVSWTGAQALEKPCKVVSMQIDQVPLRSQIEVVWIR